MGSLGYVCWALCLVQVAIVHALPEFGTSLEFPQSPSVSAVALDISVLFEGVYDVVNIELSSQIPGSTEQLSILVDFAESLSEMGKDMMDALESAVLSTSDVSGSFDAVLNAYGNLIAFINDNNEGFLASVAQGFGAFLEEALLNSMDRAFNNLMPFRDALEDLRDAVAGASEVGDVSNALFRELLRTMRTLRAHLPVVSHVFQRAGANIQDADTFFANFNAAAEELMELLEDDFDMLQEKGTMLLEFVEGELDGLNEVYTEVDAALQTGLAGPLESSPALPDLQTALDAIMVDGSALLQALKDTDAAAALSAFLEDLDVLLLDEYYDGPVVSGAVSALLSDLLQSDVYANYCFHKYRAGVMNLLSIGRGRALECIAAEVQRRGKLQQLVQSLTQLLSYDVHDLWSNLKPCEGTGDALDTCLSDLTAIYTSLGEEHTFKYGVLQEVFATELVASRTRLQMCLTTARSYSSDNLIKHLVSDMEGCFDGL